MEEVRSIVRAEHAFGLLSGVSRLRKDTFISDFSIKVEERNIPVHRAVLAVTSGYFHAMFSHDVQEVDKGFVDMKEVTFEAIEQSMDFVYTGEADINMGNVKSVAYAAELIQLPGLSKLCSNYLKYNIDVENCLSTKALADMYNWDKLKVLAENFAIQHFEALISTELFAELDLSNLVTYLKALEVDHKVIWRAIITWVGKFLERDNQLLCLMETAHLEEFPFSYTINTVLQEPLVTKSKSAKNFAVSSLFCDRTKLKWNVNLDNCFILNDLASNSESTDAKDAVKDVHRFMMENFDSISSRSEYLNLSYEELKLFFESPETRYSSELSKLSSLFHWTENEDARKEFFPDLFSLVDLGQLPHKYLYNTLKNEPLLKEFRGCMKRLYQEFGATSTELKNESSSNSPKHFAVLDQETASLRLVEFGPKGYEINDLPSPPKKNKPMAIVNANGQMYLVNGKKVFSLNKDGKWAEKTTLNFPIPEDTIAIANQNVLYMTVESCIIYHDLEHGTFGLSFSDLCSGFCIAIMGDFVYAMGGSGSSRRAKRRAFDLTGAWSDFTQMIQGRAYASATSLGKRLYVLGGIYAGEVLDSAEYYQEDTDAWTKVMRMISKRANFTVVSVDEKLYAIGGNHRNSFERSPADTIEVYNAKVDSWELTGVLMSSTKSLSACEVQGWMAQLTSQESNHRIINIGPEGKNIKIGGYGVNFRPNAFIVETKIKLSLIANPDDLPPNMDPLAPALDFTEIPRIQSPIEVRYGDGMLLQKFSAGKWRRTTIAHLSPDNTPVFTIQQTCCVIAVAQDRDFQNERVEMEMALRKRKYSASSIAPCWMSDGQTMRTQKTITSKNLLEEIKSEFAQKIKEKAEIAHTINPKGGDVQIYGSSLNFPPSAVKKEEEITLSLDNNPENYPPNRVAIAPILGFKPSMRFDKPVTVGMQTWFSALEGETIPGILSSRKHGSDWKDVGEVILGSTNEVKFTVTHFCEISLGVAPQHIDAGKYTLFNDIYLQRRTALVHSTSYLDQKSEAMIRGTMRAKNCATFSTKTLQICGKSNQKVSLKLDITEPQKKSLKKEFPIQKALKMPIHHIQFEPYLQLKDYDGLVRGEFLAQVDEKDEDDAILSREWPVTLDPRGQPVIQNIAAGIMVDGQSQATSAIKDATINVHAVSN